MKQPDHAGGPVERLNLLSAIILSDWSTKLDHKIATIIINRYYKAFDCARASLRFLERGTKATRPNVIASLRRLVENGAFSVLREGAGTRPTEYKLHFDFQSSGIADDTSSSGIADDTSRNGSGIADNTPSGSAGDTSRGASGIAHDTKTLLKNPLTSGVTLKDKSTPAPAHGLAAAPVGADLKVRDFTIDYAELDKSEDDGSDFIYVSMVSDDGTELDDCIYTQSDNQKTQEEGQIRLAELCRAIGMDAPEDVSDFVGCKLKAIEVPGPNWSPPRYIPADEWGKRAMGIAA
ncbi:hypothetical protein [Rhizobium rhizogenes]|uniref:Uncharacterized protein n=1 Tax=Rhizobium rhizogenes (strain K84 / ATCC BAA-868) TaxID=311403 RepID=B9JAV5_RHIR8|nr:hypothetical protein [Rhizobium rhizogenes]ACM25788.1 hypothetical protein Arad_1322 [Rhizobium rhizogenes K84]NTG06484.1 hypothetical protein [Rhizobium rhizogenes]